MKKKNQKTTDSSAAALIPTRSTADLKALIQSHSDFFDRLIELIPARFYLPPDDDVSDNPKPYFHGLSKAAKASLKRQSKQNLKLARRNRLDPDKISHSSTLDLLKQSLDTSAHGGEVAEIPPQDVPRAIDLEEKNGGDGNDGEKGQEKQVTYEELREKLRKKIESLRGNRGEGNRSARKGREDNKDRDNHRGEKKRKRDGEGSSGKGVEVVENDSEEIIEYGKVKIGDDEMEGEKRKKKRKMSKVKELDRAKRLEEVKKENPRVAEREWWRAAENRAMGVKVHDDPRLLRESMKKEKKRKEKNAEKWKERIEGQEKAKEGKQQKRKENIEGRIRDKKMRKIAKREKKLMRPGFEGRKDEYITKD
ncbi:uncharacterized protein [Coffea arabica]|uniref:Ribosomal RNA-processing protein 14-C-like n=1 Tax=Coffea arabica TaxID=13443 RepID=A0ABM4U3X7_COFAR|nr:ribosomal RNA-processing protein 14-C-like [Coffea arabica]